MEIGKYYYLKSNYPCKEVTTTNEYIYIIKVLEISGYDANSATVDLLADNSNPSVYRNLGIFEFPNIQRFKDYNWTIKELDKKVVKILYGK